MSHAILELVLDSVKSGMIEYPLVTCTKVVELSLEVDQFQFSEKAQY